jgi:hypothetical protein
MIVYNFDNFYPCFAKIRCIIKTNENIEMVLIKFETISYLDHFLGYELREPTDSYPVKISLSELKNKFPIDLYTLNGKLIVSPKYPVE